MRRRGRAGSRRPPAHTARSWWLPVLLLLLCVRYAELAVLTWRWSSVGSPCSSTAAASTLRLRSIRSRSGSARRTVMGAAPPATGAGTGWGDGWMRRAGLAMICQCLPGKQAQAEHQARNPVVSCQRRPSTQQPTQQHLAHLGMWRWHSSQRWLPGQAAGQHSAQSRSRGAGGWRGRAQAPHPQSAGRQQGRSGSKHG